MKISENVVQVKDLLTKSSLPASDFVINPYIGCPHGCKYCYASFMKRFTGHKENWGEFIDIKECEKPINIKKISHKSVFLSSVTDCYNPYEEKYKVTRGILEQLVKSNSSVTISTKSDLILRDLDLLVQFKDLKVAVSVNTLSEEFQTDMDQASTIWERVAALKKLHEQGIDTVLFMSPIFPGLTDFKDMIEHTSDFVSEYWFENLNLRSAYQQRILAYISRKYPQFVVLYQQIYVNKETGYWEELSKEISLYCEKNNICYTNYFYHNKNRIK